MRLTSLATVLLAALLAAGCGGEKKLKIGVAGPLTVRTPSSAHSSRTAPNRPSTISTLQAASTAS